MATLYSLQYANIVAVPSVINPGRDIGGRKVGFYFKHVLTGDAADANDGDIIYLTKIGPGFRVVGGWCQWGDIGATNAVLHIGLVGNTDAFAASLAVQSASQSDIANTIALNRGYLFASELDIVAEVDTADFDGAADTYFEGLIYCLAP